MRARWFDVSGLALPRMAHFADLGSMVAAAHGSLLGRVVAGGARAGRRVDASDDLVARAGALGSLAHARTGARARAEPHRRGALPRRRAALAEQLCDAGRVRVARRAQLTPCAVARLLVVAPADELRAVPEAVALHLVVAHLDDD